MSLHRVSWAELLLNRLDAISELLDDQRYAEARDQLYGRRWLAGLEVEGVPTEALRWAQQWIDTAFDSLSEPHLDPALARNALLQVRRVLTR
jgi:hypothetical protein